MWVVHGDTTSTLAAATVGFYKGVPVAHVEAGLRTYDQMSPFPEEFNRHSVSLMASMCFAPTNLSASNLLQEGVASSRIWVTGNTAIDSTRFTSTKTQLPAILESFSSEELAKKKLFFLTMHRRENFAIMNETYDTIREASKGCSECLFLIPVHPNPKAGDCARRACELDKRFLCSPGRTKLQDVGICKQLKSKIKPTTRHRFVLPRNRLGSATLSG